MIPNYASSGMPQTGAPYFPPMPCPPCPMPPSMCMPSPYAQYGGQYPGQYGGQMYPKSQNNAVNIEIIGPTAGSSPGAPMPGAPMPFYPGMAQLMQPQMPQVPMQQMPPYMMMPPPPPMPPMGPEQMMQPPPYMMPPVPVPPPAGQEAPVQPQPVPPQPEAAAPPPPAVDQPQPTAAPQEQASSASVAPLVNSIKVLIPQQGGKPATLEEQATSLKAVNEYINGISKMDPATQQEVNKHLLPNDGNTFKALAALASSDSSGFTGEEKQKADEVRVMSLLTLANLQKYFRQEFDNQIKKGKAEGVPPISLGELPGIQTQEQIIKSDPNPEIREAGIFALMGVADPNNKQDIQTLKAVLQTAAASDTNEKVKATANEALKAVETNNAQPKAQPEAQATAKK